MMTIAEAVDVLNFPADKLNSRCVRDAKWRLRDVLKIARILNGPEDQAPGYVLEKVRDLKASLAPAD